MRPSLPLSLLSALALAAAAPAQGTLFLRDGGLSVARPVDRDPAAALTRLLAGPTGRERAQGLSTAVPSGIGLVAVRRAGDHLTVVLDSGFAVAAARGAPLEEGLEQIVKTALYTSGAAHLHLRVRLDDGSEVAAEQLLDGPKSREEFRPSGARPAPRESPGVSGALTGRTIVVSPGHGYYWHSSLGWTTQRPLIDGLIEDIHTNEIAIRYLIPALENLGAHVISCRERGEIPRDRLGDNDQGAPFYVETGTWSTSGSTGYAGGTYRFATGTATTSATATWDLPVVLDGLYPVYVFYRAGSNRATDTRFTVHHSGGADEIRVDQTRHGLTWRHLGDFWFTRAEGARIVLDNQTSLPGRVVIADAVRIGGGLGSIARGGSTSGRPRWQEAARYWTQFAGAPASVYNPVAGGEDNSDDVTARPRYAEWRGADAYFSLHTNAGGGSGTDTFIYNGGATAGSSTLQQRVHNQVIADIRSLYDPNWTNRGLRSANFGEVRLLRTMPGVLMELAFHDTPGSRDHRALHDPAFRRIAGEAIAKGILGYFAPTAPFPPQPPTALRVTQDGSGGLQVAWDLAPGATFYTVEQSADGKGFVEVAQVPGTSWSTGPLPHHSLWSFRVRAWNGSGRSFPTEVLTAGTDHTGAAQVLLVQGFDRLERSVKFPDNTFDYLRLHGDAIRRAARFSVGFDAASNEAVQRGSVPLARYRVVDWACGEESTRHESFDPLEQFLVRAYVNGGGRLLVTGSEIGWDLDANGSTQDRDFYRNVLGARYVADDAGTYGFLPAAGGVFQGLPAGRFDDGRFGTYDVDWPDVVVPNGPNGTLCMRYDVGSQGAGVQVVAGSARTVVLGFPLETITDPDLRAAVMQRALAFLLEPLPLSAPDTARIGTQWPLVVQVPPEPNAPYLLALSDAVQPGIALPGGGLLPLRDGFLVAASLDPTSPAFSGFLGTLDGSGRAQAHVNVPAMSFLVGAEFFASGLTMLPTGPPLESRVLNWVRVAITP